MPLEGKKISELARATSVRDDSLLVVDNGGTESNSVYVSDLLKKAATNKQNKLTAGQNIVIQDDVISAPALNARNIGEIIPSVLPLKDAGLHLLDGTVIDGNGIYGDFVDYIADLYNENPNASYFAKSEIVVSSWSQPNLASNGTMGGGLFALTTDVLQLSGSIDNIYSIMNNSIGASFHSVQNVTTGHIDFYNPTPLKITNIHVQNQTDSGSANRASATGIIYGSNDGTNWTTISTYTNTQQNISGEWDISLSSNTTFYKYYRWESTSGGSGGYWTIANIKFTAVQQLSLSADEYWQYLVSQYGSCGKFVYDSVNNVVRLPRINGFIESTIDFNKLGNLTEAGLPNITGGLVSWGAGAFNTTYTNGAFSCTPNQANGIAAGSAGSDISASVTLNASRSNSIYGNSTTVQPQSIKVLYYIVVATSIINDTNADASQVTSLINFKANNDLSNVTLPTQHFIAQSISWGMPDYNRGTFLDRNTLQGFIAPYDGLLFGKADWNSTGGWIYVNGHPTVAGVGERSAIGGIPLSKGDVVTYTNFDMNDNCQFYFYPFKQAF